MSANTQTMEESLRFKLIFEHSEVKRGLSETKRLAKGFAGDAGKSIAGAEKEGDKFARTLKGISRGTRQAGRDLRTMGSAFGGFSATAGQATRVVGGLTTSVAAAGGALGPLGVGAAVAGAGLLAAAVGTVKLFEVLGRTTYNARELYEGLKRYSDIDGFLPAITDADLAGFDRAKASVDALGVAAQATGLTLAREFSPTLEGLATGGLMAALVLQDLTAYAGQMRRGYEELSRPVQAVIGFLTGFVKTGGLLLGPWTGLVVVAGDLANAFLTLEQGSSVYAQRTRDLKDSVAALNTEMRVQKEMQDLIRKNQQILTKVQRDAEEVERERLRKLREAEAAAQAAAAATAARAKELRGVTQTLADARIRTTAATDADAAAVQRLLNSQDRERQQLADLIAEQEAAREKTRAGSAAWAEHAQIIQVATQAKEQLTIAQQGELDALLREQEALRESIRLQKEQAAQAAAGQVGDFGRRLVEQRLEGIDRVRAEQQRQHEDLTRLTQDALKAAEDDAALRTRITQDEANARIEINRAAASEIAQIQEEERKTQQEKGRAGVESLLGYAQQGASMVADAYQQSFQVSADNVARLQQQLAMGEEFYTKVQQRELKARIEAQKAAAMKQFAVAKAAKVAEAIASTALAAINAIAQSPPPSPFGFIGAGIATAAGGASIAAIQASQPTFHRGGFADEVSATLTRREAILNPLGRETMGDENVRRANAGQTPGGGVIVVPVSQYQHRVFNRFARDNLRMGGPISEALRGNAGGYRPLYRGGS